MENIKKILKSKKNRYSIAIIFAIVIIYLTGVWFYSTHFFPNTILNQVNVSSKLPTIAEKLVDYKNKTETFTVQFNDNKTENINLEFVDLKINRTKNMINTVNNQNPYEWPLHLFYKKDYNIEGDITLNEAKVANIVYSFQHCQKENMKNPKDAYVSYENHSFILNNEFIGNTFDVETLNQKIIKNIKSSKFSLNLTDENLYKQPKVFANDKKLNQYLSACQKYCLANITYKDTNIKLDGQSMMKWLKYDSILKDYIMNESILKEKLYNLIDKIEVKYNTVGKAKRFITGEGTYTTVRGGDLGQLVDREKEYKILKSLIIENAVQERIPELKGFVEVNNGGLGDTYIEVNIKNKKLYYFINDSYYSYDILFDKNQKINEIKTGAYLLKQKNITNITVLEEIKDISPDDNFIDNVIEDNDNTPNNNKEFKQFEEVNQNVIGFSWGDSTTHETIYISFDNNNELYNSLKVNKIPIVIH